MYKYAYVRLLYHNEQPIDVITVREVIYRSANYM